MAARNGRNRLKLRVGTPDLRVRRVAGGNIDYEVSRSIARPGNVDTHPRGIRVLEAFDHPDCLLVEIHSYVCALIPAPGHVASGRER
jgi:hypothetical protein